jgi:alpha-glucosidase
MRPLVRATFAGREGATLRFAFDSGWEGRLLVLADDLVRVLFVRDATLREPRSWMIAPHGAEVPWHGRDRLDTAGFSGTEFSVDADDGSVVIATAALRVHARLAPFRLHWMTPDGQTFAMDRSTHAYQWSERNDVLRHYVERAPRDQYYGLGDKTGPLDKHGRRVRTVAVDALGYNGETSDPLYKHWPFLIVRESGSETSSGIFYDTLAPTTFDLGCEYDNYHGFYRYTEIDGGDLDYYIFLGPRIRDVVRKFTELTGRMAFGPRWSLGYANTAMSLTDAADAQAQLIGFAQDVVKHDVPLSAFHFGSGYTSIGPRRYVFTWNRAKFPEPRTAIDHFRRLNIRTVVNLKPCLLDDHPSYPEVARLGAFVNDARTGSPCVGQFWDGEGAHIDFTHPEGIRWWQQELKQQVLDYGIDAGWNDNNEYEIWDDFGTSHGFGTPLAIERSRPLHALLMTRATYEAQARHAPDERAFTITRAGPPGIQRYAQTWSGDNTTSWHTLRWNIRMGLTMSLCGMFNTGHDVGGFHGPVPDAELLVRWVQNGCFSPRFIMNSWKAGGEVNTPWLHPDALEPIRAAIRLRYSLLPYLYSLYRRAAFHGEPMLRPLFYDFESDPQTFAETDDFLLGADLLVANVVEPGQRTRGVYLPRGPQGWYDFWTGEYHVAGATVSLPAPLERIPLLIAAGAVIPMTDATDFAKLHDEPSRALHVFPHAAAGHSTRTLYEDDGLSHAYRDGQFAEIIVDLVTTPESVRLVATKSGAYTLPYRQLRVVVPARERRAVTVRGVGVELVGPD